MWQNYGNNSVFTNFIAYIVITFYNEPHSLLFSIPKVMLLRLTFCMANVL